MNTWGDLDKEELRSNLSEEGHCFCIRTPALVPFSCVVLQRNWGLLLVSCVDRGTFPQDVLGTPRGPETTC